MPNLQSPGFQTIFLLRIMPTLCMAIAAYHFSTFCNAAFDGQLIPNNRINLCFKMKTAFVKSCYLLLYSIQLKLRQSQSSEIFK